MKLPQKRHSPRNKTLYWKFICILINYRNSGMACNVSSIRNKQRGCNDA